MYGLFLKYESGCSGNVSFLKMRAYCFENSRDVDCSDERDYEANTETAKRVLLCKCGANDWTDNGRFINEYECNCCGQFVEAYEKQ